MTWSMSRCLWRAAAAQGAQEEEVMRPPVWSVHKLHGDGGDDGQPELDGGDPRTDEETRLLELCIVQEV